MNSSGRTACKLRVVDLHLRNDGRRSVGSGIDVLNVILIRLNRSGVMLSISLK